MSQRTRIFGCLAAGLLVPSAVFGCWNLVSRTACTPKQITCSDGVNNWICTGTAGPAPINIYALVPAQGYEQFSCTVVGSCTSQAPLCGAQYPSCGLASSVTENVTSCIVLGEFCDG